MQEVYQLITSCNFLFDPGHEQMNFYNENSHLLYFISKFCYLIYNLDYLFNRNSL